MEYRQKLERNANAGFEFWIQGTEASKTAQAAMTKEMERRIGPGHEELKKKLIPSWPPGCRRITPGDGYLEALVAPSK